MDPKMRSNIEGKITSEEPRFNFRNRNEDGNIFPVVPYSNLQSNDRKQQAPSSKKLANTEEIIFQEGSKQSKYEKQIRKPMSPPSNNPKVIKGVSFPDPIVEESIEESDFMAMNNKKGDTRSSSLSEEPVLNYLNQSNEFFDSDFSQLPSDNSSTPRNFSDQNIGLNSKNVKVNDIFQRIRENEYFDDNKVPKNSSLQDHSVHNKYRQDALLDNPIGNSFTLKKSAPQSSSILQKRLISRSYNSHIENKSNISNTNIISKFQYFDSKNIPSKYGSESNLLSSRNQSLRLNFPPLSSRPKKIESNLQGEYFSRRKSNLNRTLSSNEMDKMQNKFGKLWSQDSKKSNSRYIDPRAGKNLFEAMQPSVLGKYRTKPGSSSSTSRAPPSLHDFTTLNGYKRNTGALGGKTTNTMQSEGRLNDPLSFINDLGNSKTYENKSNSESEISISSSSVKEQ